MKLNAKYNSHLFDNKGRSVLQLTIDNPYQARMLSELKEDVVYSLEIKKSRSKRSINQNAFFWKMLTELEKVSDYGLMTLYMYCLEEADAKPTYLMGNDDLLDTLIDTFRAVKKHSTRNVIDEQGNETTVTVYKCYPGSSKFNTEEMNKLIDIAISYCHEYNIDSEVLRIE